MEKPPDDPLKLAQLQRKRLYAEVKVQNEQIRRLEGKVQESGKSRTAYEDVTMMIRRLWDRLNDDLVHLSKQTGVLQNDGKEEVRVKPEPNGIKCSDPFLLALVGSNRELGDQAAKNTAQLREEYSEVERLLQSRADQTCEQLRRLHDLINRQHAAADQKASVLRDAASPEQEPMRAQLDSQTKAIAKLRGEVDAQRGVARTHADEAAHLTGQLGAERLRCLELDTQLADRDAEVVRLNKRIVQNQEGGLAAQASLAARGLPEDVTASASGADAAGRGANGGADAACQIRDLKARLDKAGAELANEKTEHVQTRRQLADAKAEAGNEGWVHTTKLFIQLTAEAERVRKESVELAAQNTHAALERQQVEGVVKQLQRKVAEGEQYARMCKGNEETRIRMEAEKRQLTADLAASEQAVLHEKHARGNAQTVSELQEFLKTVVSERNQLAERLASSRKASTLGAAAAHLEGAEKGQRVAESEACTLREQLSDREQEAAALQTSLDSATKRQAELHAMVKVLTSIADDPRDLVECRTSERLLTEQVASLTERLASAQSAATSQGNGHASSATPVDAPMDTDAAVPSTSAPGPAGSAPLGSLWRRRAEEARAERDALKQREADVTSRLALAQQELLESKAELDDFMKEIEMTGSAFEDMQGQNSRLLTRLAERDEQMQHLQSNIVKGNRTIKSLTDERVSLNALIEQRDREREELLLILAAREQAIVDAHASLTGALAASAQLQIDATSLQRNLEANRADLRAKDGEVAAYTEQVERLKGEMSKVEHELVMEGQKRKRTEEDAQATEVRLRRVQTEGVTSVAVGELTEENAALKRLMRCHLCNERPKSCIISKCWHLFCRECVQKNLENRNRKCPRCGIAYGSADVHDCFL